MDKNLILKAKQAKSPEELIALAKENGTEMTEESAKAYFDQLHKSGELADEELDNVAGGSCYNDGRPVVTVGHCCTKYECKKCGGSGNVRNSSLGFQLCKNCGCFSGCGCCQHCTYEKGLWLCNHPKKRKK